MEMFVLILQIDPLFLTLSILLCLKNFLSAHPQIQELRQIEQVVQIPIWLFQTKNSFDLFIFLILPVQKSSSMVQGEMGPKFHHLTIKLGSSPPLFGKGQKFIAQGPPSLNGHSYTIGRWHGQSQFSLFSLFAKNTLPVLGMNSQSDQWGSDEPPKTSMVFPSSHSLLTERVILPVSFPGPS